GDQKWSPVFLYPYMRLWEVIPYLAAVRVDNWESVRGGNRRLRDPMVSKTVGSFFVSIRQPLSRR
ncbi:MAG: hypothetical protein K2G52_11325, partial [Muribaculaceae bacterium]|nr:hypothetical protein [Muribaculaceae bacterium]